MSRVRTGKNGKKRKVPKPKKAKAKTASAVLIFVAAYLGAGMKEPIVETPAGAPSEPEIAEAASAPLCPARDEPQSVAACLSRATGRILYRMGTNLRETIYGR